MISFTPKTYNTTKRRVDNMETEMPKSTNGPFWRHSYVNAIYTYKLKKTQKHIHKKKTENQSTHNMNK